MGSFLSGVVICSFAGAGGMLPVAICGQLRAGSLSWTRSKLHGKRAFGDRPLQLLIWKCCVATLSGSPLDRLSNLIEYHDYKAEG
jgi:hypothetical protein